MVSCPRCTIFVDAGAAYCGTCGRARIVEGLRAPVIRPTWQQSAWKALVGLVALWLVITIGVAFLREARAVRISRKLLAEQKAPDAWAVLETFLSEHPQHLQALFLCGKATIRLGAELRGMAHKCLADVSERSPELAKELKEDYRQALAEQTRALGCNVDGFKQLYSWAEKLGDPTFPAGVIEELDGMVEACHSSQNDYGIWQLAATMAERGQEKQLIEQGYVPAIGKALAQAKYAQAKGLALQAERIAPDGAAAVEAALNGERQKVTSTLRTLRRLCDSLKNHAGYHTGSSWCFPAATPEEVQSAVDGWGGAVLYSPLQPDQAGACNQGFTLTSLGADGSVTEGNDRSPAGEIICQYLAGWEAWQEPNQYWKADAG